MKILRVIRAQYHLVIATVTMLTMIVCGGITNAFNGAVLIPVTQSLGISRGDFSLATTVICIVGVILNLFSGVLFVKFGYRKLIAASLTLSALGYLIGSGCNSLAGLCAAGVMQGMYDLSIRSGTPRLLSRWYHRHYGLVTGLITATSGLGGSLFSMVLTKTALRFGWRGTYIAVAACFFIIVLLIALLVRDRPSEMGLRPVGEGYIPKKSRRIPMTIGTDLRWLSLEKSLPSI